MSPKPWRREKALYFYWNKGYSISRISRLIDAKYNEVKKWIDDERNLKYKSPDNKYYIKNRKHILNKAKKRRKRNLLSHPKGKRIKRCWICSKVVENYKLNACNKCLYQSNENTKRLFGRVNFSSMTSEPTCEAEVVYLFSHILHKLGIKDVIKVSNSGIDFVCKTKNDKTKYIEIEYDLTRIRSHFKSNIARINWVVYWKEGKINSDLLNRLKGKKLIDLRRLFSMNKSSNMYIPHSVLRRVLEGRILNFYSVAISKR